MAINIFSAENREGRVDVASHPDSDKIGVWPGDEHDELVFRRDTAVPWSD